jgi:hypothetical protein
MRLARIRTRLEGSRFNFGEHREFVETTCLGRNRIRCHQANERFGRITLGMTDIEFEGAHRQRDSHRRVLLGDLAASQISEDEIARFARVAGGIVSVSCFAKSLEFNSPMIGITSKSFWRTFPGRTQGWEIEA